MFEKIVKSDLLFLPNFRMKYSEYKENDVMLLLKVTNIILFIYLCSQNSFL